MKPWWWRRFAVLMGVGALVVSPWLAGLGVLLSIGVSLDELRYGIAWDYAQVLEQPGFRPVATRMRVAGAFGVLVLPAIWVAWLWRERESWRSVRDRPRSPYFLRPDELPRDGTWSYPAQPPLARRGFRHLRQPAETSLLIVADPVGIAVPTLGEAVLAATGPLLVVDFDDILYRQTSARRRREHEIVRLAPFGGGLPWNPLAAVWTAQGIDDLALRALADCWFPERRRMERAFASQVHAAFATLVHAVDETLRADGERVPPAPGDLCRLLAPWAGLNARMLEALAALPARRPATRDALRSLAELGDEQLKPISDRLAESLRVFACDDLDAGTRGHGFTFAAHRDSTIYLHVPLARSGDAVPVIEAFVAQWRAAVHYADAAVVIHALDVFPPLPCATAPDDKLRYLASTSSLAGLFMHDGDAPAISRRFACLAWHAGSDLKRARVEANALQTYTSHRSTSREAKCPEPPGADDLRKLRRGEQLIFAPGLSHAVRCPRPVFYRRSLPAPTPEQGASMPFPKSLATLVAMLITACSSPAQTEEAPVASSKADACRMVPFAERTSVSVRGANLGPKRFCLLERLFNGPWRPTGNTIGFMLNWPTLEPPPLNFDYMANQEAFLSTLGVSVDWIERLSDEAYRQYPRNWIEPLFPNDPNDLVRPMDNLHLRNKGAPMHGLTPYYADLPAISSYFEDRDGPDTTAGRPERQLDWFVDMGPEGIPRTVIKCSVKEVPDGVRLEHGRLVHQPEVFRRATCDHYFLLPEYKATVNLMYQRIMMPDWKRIEDRIRTLLRNGELN